MRVEAVGRPWIARALVDARHVPERRGGVRSHGLSRGRPAFVPRIGASPGRGVRADSRRRRASPRSRIPCSIEHDEWIAALRRGGLDALEVYHADHDGADTAHYLAIARDMGLGVTGGSDYHADSAHGGGGPGSVSLPAPYFEQLRTIANR